jgi:hypothetical protein
MTLSDAPLILGIVPQFTVPDVVNTAGTIGTCGDSDVRLPLSSDRLPPAAFDATE